MSDESTPNPSSATAPVVEPQSDLAALASVVLTALVGALATFGLSFAYVAAVTHGLDGKSLLGLASLTAMLAYGATGEADEGSTSVTTPNLGVALVALVCAALVFRHAARRCPSPQLALVHAVGASVVFGALLVAVRALWTPLPDEVLAPDAVLVPLRGQEPTVSWLGPLVSGFLAMFTCLALVVLARRSWSSDGATTPARWRQWSVGPARTNGSFLHPRR